MYQFFISSEDSSDLWLSSDDDPRNTRMIAYIGEVTVGRLQRYILQSLHSEINIHVFFAFVVNRQTINMVDLLDKGSIIP